MNASSSKPAAKAVSTRLCALRSETDAPLEIFRTEDLDKVTGRNGTRDNLRPLRHRGDRCKEPAHQLKNHNERKHHKRALQHRRRLIGYQDAQPRHDKAEQYRGKIDSTDITHRHQPVSQPPDLHFNRYYHQADDPEWYQYWLKPEIRCMDMMGMC